MNDGALGQVLKSEGTGGRVAVSELQPDTTGDLARNGGANTYH